MPAVSPTEGYTAPLFLPESDWKAPTEPPNLNGVARLGLDTETRDPGLLTFGPGIRHGKANCVGISLATADQSWYFPTEHPDGNCQWDVYSWLKDVLKENRDYVGANLPYDIEILDHYGITVGGRWLDTQVAEPLLDEERQGGYKLDVLAKHYLGVGKDETLLLAAAAAFGVDPKGGLWQLPAKYVGPYAEMDALRALQVFDKQYPLLEGEDLIKVFDMETALMPIVYAMRKQGVRIDLEKTEQLGREWAAKEAALMDKISGLLSGVKVDIWSGKQLAQYCESQKIQFPRTDKGNPSFSNEWLATCGHPALQLMAETRKVVKMRRDFIDGSLLKYQINGRLHANFHQLRSDDDGTRSGRLSSSQPNLQQIPSRDRYYGPAMRSLFLPDDDDSLWFSGDFRSQEPRLLVHFANLLKAPGAAEMVEVYRQNPDTCLHTRCAELCSTSKSKAKTIGLGVTYGMGLDKLAEELGLPMKETVALNDRYHEMMPFVLPTANKARSVANHRGYVRTLLGRRSRFKFSGGSSKRQYTHKALNRILQGSGADMIKVAMIVVYQALGKIPLLSVHDENNYNIRHEKEAKELAELMENALPIAVPNRIDAGVGKNWSEAHG